MPVKNISISKIFSPEDNIVINGIIEVRPNICITFEHIVKMIIKKNKYFSFLEKREIIVLKKFILYYFIIFL